MVLKRGFSFNFFITLFSLLLFIAGGKTFAEEIQGEVVKVKKKKLTVMFPSAHGIKKGKSLKVYAGKNGEPGKLLGKLKVKKVKGRKVIGTFKGKGKVSKKKLRKAIILADRGSSASAGGFGSSKKVPMLYVNPVAGYGLMTGYESVESSSAISNDQVEETMKNINSQKDVDGSNLFFGGEATVYPLTPLGKEFFYSLLGAEFLFHYYMTTSSTVTVTKGGETETKPFSEANPGEDGKDTATVMKAAVNFRYAKFIKSKLFSATTIKFFPFYRFTITTKSSDEGENNSDKSELVSSNDSTTSATPTPEVDPYFTFMTLGLHQHFLIGNISTSLYFYYPIITDYIHSNGKSITEQVQESAESSGEGGNPAPEFSVVGYTIGGQVGWKQGFFTVHLFGEYEKWGFQVSATQLGSNVTWGSGFTFLNFGLMAGIVF